MTEERRDPNGYRYLRLNLPLSYVTINPGSDAALNTPGTINCKQSHWNVLPAAYALYTPQPYQFVPKKQVKK